MRLFVDDEEEDNFQKRAKDQNRSNKRGIKDINIYDNRQKTTIKAEPQLYYDIQPKLFPIQLNQPSSQQTLAPPTTRLQPQLQTSTTSHTYPYTPQYDVNAQNVHYPQVNMNLSPPSTTPSQNLPSQTPLLLSTPSKHIPSSSQTTVPVPNTMVQSVTPNTMTQNPSVPQQTNVAHNSNTSVVNTGPNLNETLSRRLAHWC